MMHRFFLTSLSKALVMGIGFSTLSTAAPHYPVRRQSNSTSDSRNIYVAGYDGLVRTLNYDGDSGLTLAHTSPGCETNPTWLTIQPSLNRLWCLDEGWVAGYGTLNLFTITSSDGALEHQLRHDLSAGPVQTEWYGPDSAPYLAIAQYGGPDDGTIRGGITLHAIDPADGTVTESFNHTFPALESPGPKPAQGVPRGHGVTLDPTGDFLVVPDLGADKLRVFAIDAATGDANEHDELQMPIGTGPRHAEFAVVGEHTYLYLISEFASSITTFVATYGSDGLQLKQVGEPISTFGPNTDPKVRSAAEIKLSPDGKFIVVSNREDGSFGDGSEDSLATFEIQKAEGSLKFVQLAPSGGTKPRHFEINEDGTRVVVANQGSERIVVLERDVESGKILHELVGLEIDTDGAGTPAAIWG